MKLKSYAFLIIIFVTQILYILAAPEFVGFDAIPGIDDASPDIKIERESLSPTLSPDVEIISEIGDFEPILTIPNDTFASEVPVITLKTDTAQAIEITPKIEKQKSEHFDLTKTRSEIETVTMPKSETVKNFAERATSMTSAEFEKFISEATKKEPVSDITRYLKEFGTYLDKLDTQLTDTGLSEITRKTLTDTRKTTHERYQTIVELCDIQDIVALPTDVFYTCMEKLLPKTLEELAQKYTYAIYDTLTIKLRNGADAKATLLRAQRSFIKLLNVTKSDLSDKVRAREIKKQISQLKIARDKAAKESLAYTHTYQETEALYTKAQELKDLLGT